jgi:Zn finger protein HypA/HybF involved in hydrogenase expression
MSDDPLACRDCDWSGGYSDYAQTRSETTGTAVCPRCKGQLQLAQYRPR